MRADRAALAIALLLLSLNLAQAQEEEEYSSAAPGKFFCGSGANTRLLPLTDQFEGMVLSALAGIPADLPADAKLKRFGPFDEGRFGVSFVEFYQFPIAKDTGWLATVRIYVRVVRSQGEAWYAVATADSDALDVDPPSRAEEGTARDENADESRKPKDDVPVTISTPEAGFPLFQVSYTSHWMGGNVSGGSRHVILVDLRAAPPRLAQHVECLWSEGGACSGEGSGFATKQLSCSWDHGATDYLCEQRVDLDTGWGMRSTDSRFFLLSGRDAFQPAKDSPTFLEQFVSPLDLSPLDRRAVVGKKMLHPDAGEATAIYSLLQQKRDVYLLAARGTGKSLDARFFLVVTDHPTTSMELRPAFASALPPMGYAEAELQREQAAKAPAPKVTARAVGEPLSYNVRRIYGKDDFFVLQVTVKEGGGHAVYWIGVDQRQPALVADLYRVATDAEPAECQVYRQEEGAASYHLLPGTSFRALLEIEPEHSVLDRPGADRPLLLANDNPGRESQEPPQVCTWRLSWDRAKGFVFAENPVRCRSGAPRSISISDDGKLTTFPVRPLTQSPPR